VEIIAEARGKVISDGHMKVKVEGHSADEGLMGE